jgi:hypothetical protein
MSNAADARRRWFGTFFLFIAIGLLIWGQTVLKPHLGGIVYVLYWLGCFVFTGLALITAWLDLRAVRKRASKAQGELFEETLSKVKLDDGSQPPPDSVERDK